MRVSLHALSTARAAVRMLSRVHCPSPPSSAVEDGLANIVIKHYPPTGLTVFAFVALGLLLMAWFGVAWRQRRLKREEKRKRGAAVKKNKTFEKAASLKRQATQRINSP